MSESTLFLIVFCILVVYGFILWNFVANPERDRLRPKYDPKRYRLQ